MTHSSNPAVQAHLLKALAAMWQRNHPQILDRLAALDRATAAATTGRLTPVTLEKAVSAAHNLAGSLGMFGLQEGTRLARELEEHLLSGEPNPARMQALTAALHKSIESSTVRPIPTNSGN